MTQSRQWMVMVRYKDEPGAGIAQQCIQKRCLSGAEVAGDEREGDAGDHRLVLCYTITYIADVPAEGKP